MERTLLGGCLVALTFPTALLAEWSGSAALEARLFPQSAAEPVQHESHLSAAFEPQYRREWDGGRQSISIVPFGRLDGGDPERTHADLREFLWQRVGDAWELHAGVGKVFWGVSESQHLVDIINQTDLIEDPDGEDKLGQPMLNLARVGERGIWQLFVLPGFRERTFPGEEGRLRSRLPVDTSQARYESPAEERHIDWAVRWSHYFGEWDIGLSHFNGTGRAPRLLLGTDEAGNAVLVPHYDLIRQTGLDLQWTHEAWLWKLEWIRRSGEGEAFNAATGGFEYTWSGVWGTRADVGLLTEYLYDGRGAQAATPFEDDLFVGLRVAPNDEASSQLLLGAILDEDGSRLYSLEASRRFGNQTVLRLEGRLFAHSPAESSLSSFERDDYLQLRVAYYF